jgi:hypothetical protein
MNDDQINSLLEELVETRKMFEKVIGHIEWNRRNTIIQYVLIVVVVVMMLIGGIYYFDDKQRQCEAANATRANIAVSLDAHANNIGVALGTVVGASPGAVQEYYSAYVAQPRPEILEPRKC